MALTLFSNLGRGTMTTLPQVLHLIRKSTPVRMTSQISPPQGWVFFIFTVSPILYLTGKDMTNPSLLLRQAGNFRPAGQLGPPPGPFYIFFKKAL